MKKILAVSLTIILLLCTCGAVTAAARTGIRVHRAGVPSGSFQKDVSFPDAMGGVEPMLADNSTCGFLGYHGQGELYVTVGQGVEKFSLFINNKKVHTGGMKAGQTYRVDFSGAARDGTNQLQLSNVEPRNMKQAIRVRIPYPVVKNGSAKEGGLNPKTLDAIDDIVSSDIHHGFSSAQMAVVRNGRLVYQNAWGLCSSYDENGDRLTSGKKVDNDTLYDLASNTKMYSVNYAVQYLVTKGKLDLDTKITDIVGDRFADDTVRVAYPNRPQQSLETQRKWKRSLTIRDVLKHQAGFPADPSYHVKKIAGPLYSGSDGSAATRQKTLESICKTPLMYEPGTETLYSDVDYMLLCFVVEKVTGMSMQDYLKQVFWKPMGLTHITYRPLDNGFTKKDCAATELNGNTRQHTVAFPGIRTHTIQGEVHDGKAYYAMAGISGHAGLFANATDLAKLASVMLTGGYGNHRYFSQDVLDTFTAPKSEKNPDWGLGWYRNADGKRVKYFSTYGPSRAIGHQGWTGTLTLIDPDRQLVLVFLTNKINTPMSNPKKDIKSFNGNQYVTSTLGFVTQLLYMGLDGQNVNDSLPAILADMVGEKCRQASGASGNNATVQAAYALNDALKKYTRQHPGSSAREYARQASGWIRELQEMKA